MLLKKLLIIVFIFLFFIFIYNYYFSYSLKYVKSGDGKNQLVRNMDNKEEVAEMFSEIKSRINRLLKHLKSKYPKNEQFNRLRENFDPENIRETDVHDSGTSYSINKGSELSICVRDKNDEKYSLHELNTIMFVVIHELSHIMSKSYGHNEEFGDNFKLLLQEAISAGIYSNENYSLNNKDYCGIKITSNPL